MTRNLDFNDGVCWHPAGCFVAASAHFTLGGKSVASCPRHERDFANEVAARAARQ